MINEHTNSAIESMLSDNRVAFGEKVNDILQAKIVAALEIKRAEIGQNYLNDAEDEETVEITTEETNIDEGLRLISTHGDGDGRHAKVYHDSEWKEYRVKHYTGSKHHDKADYHSDDKDDAHNTAQHWIKEDLDEEAYLNHLSN